MLQMKKFKHREIKNLLKVSSWKIARFGKHNVVEGEKYIVLAT